MSDIKRIPAFPHQKEDGSPYWGMDLRDWFAGQALAGFCANTAVFAANSYNGWQLVNCSDHDLARQCLALADAMLVERKGAGR